MPKVPGAVWRGVFWVSAATLLLSLGVTITSVWRDVPIKTGGSWGIEVYRGGLAVTVGLEGSAFWDYQAMQVRSRGQMFWLPCWTVNSQAPEWAVVVPLVWLAGIAAVTTAVSGYRLRRRPEPGVCPRCRYDLSTLRPAAPCPECGTLRDTGEVGRSGRG